MGDAVAVNLDWAGTGDGRLNFALAAVEPVPLRRMLPALQSMDLEVLEEQAGTWTRPDGRVCHVYHLVLQPGPDAVDALAQPQDGTADRIRETFQAMWAGRVESDGFNALILRASLSWRQVTVLRSYSRYLRQLPLPYGQARIQRVLLDNPEAARALLALFEARFDHTEQPADSPHRIARITEAEQRVAAEIDQVLHIDADRILRAYHNLINATLRTNAFAPDALTVWAPYLVHKLDAQSIDELPQPRPLSEIFVYSPEFEGMHLRFGLVARGGLRWSDRHDDYRTEVLGLVKAQAVKNSMIVPVGAKGVFVVKARATAGGESPRVQGLRCYRQFIAALLDVVDKNADSGSGSDQRPRFGGVVCHDGSDPYLVVAADKGTATFSDSANAVALDRGYWMGDAFASGGSAGYDHKTMGITARGAWVSGDTHLAELGIDSAIDEFSAVGVGDMSGDVFGNGMLLRPGLRLVAAFDHRHIFVDPQPDTAPARKERQRLFELPQSSWDDYDRGSISQGGGVWPRTAKTIATTPEMRAALGIADHESRLTPTQLISHILRAPVDLLFNGGIGTYIKAGDEQHSDIADKVNDPVRVNAEDVRARVIVEGGNLGLSQRARIEYARRGGLVNTDAIDNAAGVDCSDHEVNIKILLDAAARSGRITGNARNGLLADMTDEVAQLVLANNQAHNRLLGDARSNAAQMVDVHARMTADLEARRGLHRSRENMPSPAEFTDLAKDDRGLTAPQLATLMAHVKLDLKAELLGGETFDDPYFVALLARYFPATLRRQLGEPLPEHPLRREIITTSIVNRVLATSGLTFAFRLSEETGAATADIVRAHAVVSEVFDLDTLWGDIYAAGLSPALTNAMIIEGRRLLDRAARWFVLNRPHPLDVDTEIARFSDQVAMLRGQLGSMLRGQERESVTEAHDDMVARGVPGNIAQRISESLYAFSLLDIIEVAHVHDEDSAQLARIYFELSDRLGVDRLLLAVSSLPRGGRWHALARLALREDLYRSLRDLTIDVTKLGVEDSQAASSIRDFEAYNRPRLDRAKRTLDEFLGSDEPDLAALSVASAQLRRLHR
ncbi:NAD-glutamate dehydrogenase [Mycobacterium sp. CBMA247]|nr:NAD-glutamate dehydrogenase [Mycolicibacterium sp. CBMA 329]MUL87929.1 NAD-glutamate dehydrogenase [Mycolicibacterium sp. CBMA 331]MUM02260.1 NAD-glutamate dehydrogenase [Mycolicibacterium sp. CBMA 334]MUM26456.1 NAD-glutamate dehydrogenase [Mycolicibacterium sp. CBMA 295]MUM38226.1 NAD-glutamate dehydrogenase [Mycolicibacterium sp. CBMA 247]MUM43994.1 NAD-glutamate dehydrogenase [Mycolicibacterium sp. CBMA 294]